MTEDPAHNRGALWNRVDLHLHTPGIREFALPNGADPSSDAGRSKIAKAYVQSLISANIRVAAITDYNGVRVEWLRLLRETAEGQPSEAPDDQITILPGAELSINVGKHGLHLLAIFSDDEDPKNINTFLQGLDRDPATPLFSSDGTHRDLNLRDNIVDALRSLRDRFACLLIVPHPDESNGLCKTLQAAQAAQLMLDVPFDALEHSPDSVIRKLQSTGLLSNSFFENLAHVESSDAHRIDEIGTKRRVDGSARATYLKISSPSLDALRLVLHDPETRLVLAEQPPPPSHARIRSLRIAGSGFLNNTHIQWNDDLNVLIGGRGVGKSAIVETLRFALGIEAYSDQTYRQELVRHALGSGGRVELLLERPVGEGLVRTYIVSRVWGEEPIASDADTGEPADVSPATLLGPSGGPTILGQREIYAVSTSDEYRLALLDELVGEEAKRRTGAVKEAIERLRSNARSVAATRTQLSKKDEHEQRLRTIQHEIEIYKKHAAAEKLNQAAALRSDGQRLRGAAQSVERLEEDWSGLPQTLIPLETAGRSLASAQSEKKEILTRASVIIDEMKAELQSLLAKGGQLITNARSELARLSDEWKQALAPLEEEINRIKQEAQTDTLDPDRLLALTEEATALAPLLDELVKCTRPVH